MARNGTGTYTLPQPPFVPNTTISSTAVNSNFSDIATALTGSLPRDGQAGMSGQFKAADGLVNLPGITFASQLNTGFYRSTTSTVALSLNGVLNVTFAPTAATFAEAITAAKAVNFAASADVASATTTNIGAATTNTVNITGTTTITAFDTVAAGVERWVKFAGILTLTYNATSLILPTAANITTAAGDTAYFKSEGSGNWRCYAYLRADGSSVAAGSNNPQFNTIELGDSSDTTLSRASAGDVNIEGNIIYRAGGADVPVADGGTGRSSHTAYAVICGGTTTTAAQQSIASVGTSGQVLTSNGAGALPTFQDITGQPIPVSSTYPVGMVAWLGDYGNGGQVADGATTSGSVLRPAVINTNNLGASPVMVTTPTAQAGTWMNVSGATLGINNNNAASRVGAWVRVS